MSTKIFYFSGTGNSLYAAKELTSKLGNTEIIPISKTMGKDIDLSCDKIGLVFPVYAWGPPRIVSEFVKSIDLKDKYIFSVATYATVLGGTLCILNNILQEKGAKISTGFGLKQPSNYIVGYGNSKSSEEEFRKVEEKAKRKIDKIADIVRNGIESEIEKNIAPINALTSLVYAGFVTHLKEQEKGFWVNENCSNCMTCEKICPTENINVIDGKRTWQGKCEMCMACIQWCPKEAIQYGKGTTKRRRYHHPEIKLEEMLKN